MKSSDAKASKCHDNYLLIVI